MDGKLVNIKKTGEGTTYGGGYHNQGESIKIGAEPAPGYCFYQWNIPEGQTAPEFEDIHTGEQTFTMPDNNIEFTAVFVKSPQNISLTGKAAGQRMRAGTELPIEASIDPVDTDEKLRNIKWTLVDPPEGVSLVGDEGTLKLTAGDKLEDVYFTKNLETTTIQYKDRELDLNHLKSANRDGKGSKPRL